MNKQNSSKNLLIFQIGLKLVSISFCPQYANNNMLLINLSTNKVMLFKVYILFFLEKLKSLKLYQQTVQMKKKIKNNELALIQHCENKNKPKSFYQSLDVPLENQKLSKILIKGNRQLKVKLLLKQEQFLYRAFCIYQIIQIAIYNSKNIYNQRIIEDKLIQINSKLFLKRQRKDHKLLLLLCKDKQKNCQKKKKKKKKKKTQIYQKKIHMPTNKTIKKK
eukprot:TRINITY_DN4379_c0_g1_i2.p1 TRINITY_DN4379_c0_g1~~TRINITY_DN4379_c0_g1_i2.p1  ORF type:complete len:220 (-),score=16.86 TRINITY_DN4379_c0_g1_i2:43-702(-)